MARLTHDSIDIAYWGHDERKRKRNHKRWLHQASEAKVKIKPTPAGPKTVANKAQMTANKSGVVFVFLVVLM